MCENITLPVDYYDKEWHANDCYYFVSLVGTCTWLLNALQHKVIIYPANKKVKLIILFFCSQRWPSLLCADGLSQSLHVRHTG